MARYFFDVDDGETVTLDEEGHEVADLQAIRRMAQRAFPDMLSDELPDSDHRQFKVQVRDAGGGFIYVARLQLDAEWFGVEAPSVERKAARPGSSLS